VAIRQIGKAPLLGGSKQALHHAGRHILLVRRSSWCCPKPLASQSHQVREIAFPDRSGGERISFPNLLEPVRHRTAGRHDIAPFMGFSPRSITTQLATLSSTTVATRIAQSPSVVFWRGVRPADGYFKGDYQLTAL